MSQRTQVQILDEGVEGYFLVELNGDREWFAGWDYQEAEETAHNMNFELWQ